MLVHNSLPVSLTGRVFLILDLFKSYFHILNLFYIRSTVMGILALTLATIQMVPLCFSGTPLTFNCRGFFMIAGLGMLKICVI